MLQDLGLPLQLWVEACITVVYFHNKIPHQILGMSTVEDDFSGKKSNVGHFKIFGSLIYFHVTKYAMKEA